MTTVQRRWEYRILDCYNNTQSTRVERADQLGADGWELVAIDRQENWIFKRPAASDVVRLTSAPNVEKLRVRDPASTRRNGRRPVE